MTALDISVIASVAAFAAYATARIVADRIQIERLQKAIDRLASIALATDPEIIAQQIIETEREGRVSPQ